MKIRVDIKKGILGIILCAIVASFIGISVVDTSASAFDTTMKDWGIEHFNKLDVGIYWYADKNNPVPTKDYEVKKDAPTIIYTHGWKPQGQSMVREGLSAKDLSIQTFHKHSYGEYPDDTEFYRYYIDKGYNVGVFYWNQLADAEARTNVLYPSFSVDTKIWTSEGGKNMTYAYYDSVDAKQGKLTKADDPTNPKKSVAVMYGENLVEDLGKDFSGTLQIAGHSMGGQLSLAVSEYLCHQYDKGNIGKNLLPDRVTLVDPYLPAFGTLKRDIYVDHAEKTYKYNEGDTGFVTALFAAEAAENIRKHGIPIEGYTINFDMCLQNYKTILGTAGETKYVEYIANKLRKNCVWVYAKGMTRFGGFNPTHVMTVDWYFHTLHTNPLKSNEGLQVPCATLPTEELHKLIGLMFVQNTPKTENPFYYEKSSYSLVKFIDGKPYDNSEAQGNIFGNIKVNNRGSKTNVTAKLFDKAGKEVQEANVDDIGYYYFSAIPEGEYNVKIFVGEKEELALEKTATIKAGTPVPVAMEQGEITIKNLDIFTYVAIALTVVLFIVLIVVLAVVINKQAKKKNEYR